jgi:hypothetical protein
MSAWLRVRRAAGRLPRVSEPCAPGTVFSVSEPENFQIYKDGPIAEVRRVEHEMFGLLLAPVAPSDVSTLVGWVAAAWGTAGWRGQASLCWPFDSSLTRRVKGRDSSLGTVLGGGPPLDRVVRETELRLLGRARLAGHDRRENRTAQ